MKQNKNTKIFWLLLGLLFVLLNVALLAQEGVPTELPHDFDPDVLAQQYEKPTVQAPIYQEEVPVKEVYQTPTLPNRDIYSSPATKGWADFGLIGLVLFTLLGLVGYVVRGSITSQSEMLKAINNNTLAINKSANAMGQLTNVIQGDIRQVDQKVDSLLSDVKDVNSKIDEVRLILASSNSSNKEK